MHSPVIHPELLHFGANDDMTCSLHLTMATCSLWKAGVVNYVKKMSAKQCLLTSDSINLVLKISVLHIQTQICFLVQLLHEP